MYNVLIADDEMTIRKGLGMMFNWGDYGFQIQGEASNGLEALSMIQKKSYDVLISDIRMPKMNGLELIKKMNELGLNTKVVIISSHPEFEYARAAIEGGAFNYVLKPINQDQLIQTLMRIKKQNDMERQTQPVMLQEAAAEMKGAASDDEVSTQLQQYIKEHCCSDINLIGIGKAFNYNPVYLGRLFSKQKGENFRSYLNYCRIKKAEQLIAEGKYKVFEISDMVGYKDLNYFCKTFKKIAGKTPGEYKQHYSPKKY